MPPVTPVGEFEQLVLLAILRPPEGAAAADVRTRLEEATGRRVTRGALYATLDRLDAKGFLSWRVESGRPARGGLPARRFMVTPEGLAALKGALAAVRNLALGLERVLGPVP